MVFDDTNYHIQIVESAKQLMPQQESIPLGSIPPTFYHRGAPDRDPPGQKPLKETPSWTETPRKEYGTRDRDHQKEL